MTSIAKKGDAFGKEKNGQASTNNHVDPAINHGALKPAHFSKPFLGKRRKQKAGLNKSILDVGFGVRFVG